ncbi:AbiH family protein [Leuconostoc mesenteroides]|uniref:AbiH family protein n=1 Tax=Leuconostoc mesenteroides TaxID=1245 RepID=UPI0023624700|nr:AbiH family protein [Leuconostoc mesenteroides]
MQHEEQLIIIGNGFDLNNGLKSSFKDFFEWLNTDLDETAQRIWDANFWNAVFQVVKLSDPTWFDIEKQIGEVIKYLQQEFAREEYIKPTFKDDFGYVKSGFFRHVMEKSQKIYFSDEYDTNSTLNHSILHLIATNDNFTGNSGKLPTSVDEIMKSLFSQLTYLEKLLNVYLLQEIDKNLEYSKITQQKISTLSTLAVDKSDYRVKVLSFNYTPIEFVTDTSALPIIVKNVHGELTAASKGDSNIILGIDQSLLFNDGALQFSIIEFTKTYRTLFLQKHVTVTESSFINKNIKIVKFYGHSLGSADYSYFQSIFDELDIYNREVYLFFYYSNYDVVDRGPEQYERVYQLMSDYGRSMQNASQGKNLLHKMQLENRISIAPLR